MTISSYEQSYLLLAFPFLTGEVFSAFTSVNDINCNNLPITINTDTVLDGPVDLTGCQDRNIVVFKIENDSTLDCNGHSITDKGYFIDYGQGVTALSTSTAIHVNGGATIMNCHINQFYEGIFRDGDNSNGSELTIKDSTFNDIHTGIDVKAAFAGLPQNVNVRVENCQMNEVIFGGVGITGTSATVHVEDTVIHGTTSTDSDNGAWGISTSGNEAATSLTVRNSKFSGFDDAITVGQKTGFVEIANIDADGCGIALEDDVENFWISSSRITDSPLYGLSFFFAAFGRIRFFDVSICGTQSNRPDLQFYNIDTTMGQPNITGFATCNRAIDFEDGIGDDVTSEYCISACSVSIGR